ncbi:MAG TPA: GNAT family N-acetyltransferase [Casimicrobiaceae bacterium]|jgi:predicted GNAT family acetyltransferase|nr:GNAT family N-acetyltransferase [Casimicrobiaceae bacterium]
MIASDLQRALDNPFWSSLTTGHAHFAMGGALARRYPPDISPIAGLAAPEPTNVSALEAIVAVGDDMATVARAMPRLPAHWEILYESRLTQMLRSERTALPEGDVDASTLGPADVPEMLALVELTKPGPFRPRTIELGTYIGLRLGRRLMAMAGERLWIDDCREVSAVCTHPDAQGRGYAKALITRVVNRMLRAGQTPILHVESANKRAIDLYRALGFVPRTELSLLYAKRTR